MGALTLGATGALDPLERGASNTLFRWRGERTPQSKVVLLLVDNAALFRAGRQPLPRRYYAQAVDKLRAAGASTVAFALLFNSPSDDPKQDEEFAQASATGMKAPHIVQGAIFDIPGVASDGRSLARLPFSVLHDEGGRGRLASAIAAPLPPLLVSQTRVGHLNVFPDADGQIRRIPHIVRFQNALYPSVALAAASWELGTDPRQIVATPDGVRLESPTTPRFVPLDNQGQVLVNWLGRDGIFPTFTLLQLLDGKIPVSTLRGATVVVGSVVAGAYTPLSTPFETNQTSLQLQANAIDDIVSNRVLNLAPLWAQIGLLLFLVAGAGAVMAPREAWGGLGWTLGLSLFLWGICLLLLRNNISMPLAVIQTALILTGAACVGVRQLTEGRDLRLLHELFDGYVGDEVLRLIKSNKPKLDGEIRHVAILFCDIRGFSALAEQFRDSPEDLLKLLNEHFAPLVQILKEHDAYVDNYVGDLVMAIFGAPVSDRAADRNTRDAVMAALEVRRAISARNRERRAAGKAVIDVGIGVHCGPAVVGDLGSSRKKHYTAIGDTVVIASRVEAMTRFYSTPFLVTEEVVIACRDHPETAILPWRFVEETQVKGRKSLTRLYTCSMNDGEEIVWDEEEIE